MKNHTEILALIIAHACCLNSFAQVHEPDGIGKHSEQPDTKSIDHLSNVEVWAGQIRKLHLDGINKRNVVSPIFITTAKLISPTSELSPFSKACMDQLKPIAGKAGYYNETYLYYDEAEDFPNGQLPKVGEIWIFTCRRGIDGGLHLLSGARLEASGKPEPKQP